MSRPTAAAFVALALGAAVTPAFAHPGHELAGAGFVAGVLHPLLGFDHLLAMVAVGVWAAQLGGRARWMMPLAFVAVMTTGAACALAGHAPPRATVQARLAKPEWRIEIVVTAAV